LPLLDLTDLNNLTEVLAPAVPELPPLAEGEKESASLSVSEDLAAFVDIEMQEIFLEEAAEVLAAGRAAVAALQQDAGQAEQMRVLRRAFHTLKGSARMVGLDAFGEAAWACEQLYNARLGAPAPQADAALMGFTTDALNYLGDWCEQIAGRAAEQLLPGPLRRAADALRWPAEQLSTAVETAEPEPEPEPVLDLEPAAAAVATADHADFVLGSPGQAASPEAGVVPEFELPEFELQLQLGDAAAPDLPVVDEAVVAVVEDLAAELAEPVASDGPESDELEPEPEPELEAQPEPALAATPAPALTSPPVLELVRSSAPAANEAAAASVAGEAAAADDEGEYPDEGEDNVKVIGGLRISITLFNIFLNEADELSRRLAMDLAEWALELGRQVPINAEALAHSLAGNAAAVGFDDLSSLARALERALERAQSADSYSEAEAQLFVRAADDIRHLLHQFAAGFLKSHDAELIARLQAYQPTRLPEDSQAAELAATEPEAAGPAEAPAEAEAEAEAPEQVVPEQETPEQDDIDPVLFPIFAEEATDLLEHLQGAVRQWLAQPEDIAGAAAAMRALHTFKGGARLTGALGLGAQAHRLESAIEAALGQDESGLADLLAVQDRVDQMAADFERLSQAQLALTASPPVTEVLTEPVQAEPEAEPEAEAEAELEPSAEPATAPPAAAREPIDWQRFMTTATETAAAAETADAAAGLSALVRVRGSLLERMAAQAGEVSIRRARLESELAQMKSSLLDLDENLERMRTQLRELELQAEAQVGSQPNSVPLPATGSSETAALDEFDLLEFDRYTRFQELTRMLAESMGDVATVQRSLQRNVQLGEDELAAQSRLTRELQDDLLRTRLVEFDSMAERMHRVVRQAARDAGRQAQLDIIGGQTELDRSVLERLAGTFEHLLRNSVSHGIEPPEHRLALGKDASGRVTLQLRQEGNEILLDVSDDGAGLDLARIRERGLQLGLLKADVAVDDAGLTQLIFAPGFSTAGQLTELSGRGVGMDVVRAEVSTLGGAIEIHTEAGRGTKFSLRLPLTTALTQVVLLRCAEQSVAVPAGLMASVQRVPAAQIEAAYASGQLQLGDQQLPFYWLGGLLGQSGRGHGSGKQLPVAVMRNGQQGLALHVDEVLGNQEVVVKHLGPQLGRVPGLAGISLLASGEVALIYNPVVLADWYGAAAQKRQADVAGLELAVPLPTEPTLAPLVLVVDDSLTVRRVTQRLLEREGYRVQLAKDGLDAMECLAAEELPALVLSDIEMPRMDGFDLLRNIRADARLAALPVVKITSRIALKHRDYAEQLGANHYLGKPYDEQVLLALIGRYTSRQIGSVMIASASEK
jgi:chemosensory pili system protein ChpA (sensor histidine kinase/response regulator)